MKKVADEFDWGLAKIKIGMFQVQDIQNLKSIKIKLMG